jgi:hypothetical protein
MYSHPNWTNESKITLLLTCAYGEKQGASGQAYKRGLSGAPFLNCESGQRREQGLLKEAFDRSSCGDCKG